MPAGVFLYNSIMRKFIILLVLFLAIVFVFLSFSELQNIVDTLEKSNWIFLSFALLFECIWLYNVATTYSSLYHLVELQESRQQLLLMATAANFVNVIAPSAGIGGMAVFIDAAKRRGQPTGRVTVVGVLYVLYDYAAFLCVLALGLIVLIRRNNLTAGELTATAILLVIALAIASLLYLGYKSAEQLGKVLAWLSRGVNRIAHPFIHRDYLHVENAHFFAREMAEGISIIRGKRKELIWPFLFALNNKALLICVMAFTFLALGTPFSVGTLVGGFSIGYLFLIVSPTPAGVGVVESVLPVALSSLRVKWAAAVLITLVYRAVTFWFPLADGLVAFRILQGKPKKQPVLDKTE
jgi:glycosyltransferase 2 family protein